MGDRIRVSCNGCVTYVTLSDSWDDVKEQLLGAAHRVLLANSREREVVGVEKSKK